MKYNVGDRIKDEKRDITLTRVRRRNGRIEYQYKCNICNYACGEGYKSGKYITEYWLDNTHLHGGTGCSCCQGRTVVPGFNNIGYTDPDIAKYIKNDIDKIRYTKYSYCKVEVECPFCHTTKLMCISNLSIQGFSCPVCSDKLPLGEKIMYILLRECNIHFVKEFSSRQASWTGRYRYDFYIEPDIIIEVMGRQHKDGSFEQLCGKTLEDEIRNDKNKKDLALKNGINHYITIDADKTDSDYIKNNIINSELKNYIDFSKINWNDILLRCEKPILIDVCEEYSKNENVTTGMICKKFELSYGVVQNYLRRGTKLGLCNYDPKNYRKENIFTHNTVNTATPIKCIETNSYFKSYGLCSRVSENAFGIKLNICSIRSVLRGEYAQHRGYHFSYVTQEEFNKAYEEGLPCYGTPFKLAS